MILLNKKGRLGSLVSRAFNPRVEGWWFETRSGQVMIKDWKLGSCCFPG